MFNYLRTNFPRSLKRLYIVNPSTSVNFLIKTMSKLVPDRYVKRSLFIMEQDNIDEFCDYYDPRVLQRRYGGKLPNFNNVRNGYWPPRYDEKNIVSKTEIMLNKVPVYYI